MRSLLTNPRAAALGVVVEVPAAAIFLAARSKSDPLGVMFIWGSLLPLPHASGISVIPLAVARHSGEKWTANPLALVLALLVVGFSVRVWGRLFLDQLPCFLGVPNCD